MIYKFIYKIVLLVIFPIIFIYSIIQSIFLWDFNFFKNKFGLALKIKNKCNLCIHCASLGEINGAKEIIKEVNKKNNILISTNTISGKKFAEYLFPELDVVYFPFDYKYAVLSWLKESQIKNVLIYETEIWPNFYDLCDSKNINICVINARLSKKILVGHKIVKQLYKKALNSCSLILCKSEYEKNKYIELQVDERLLFVPGNLKYISMQHQTSQKPFDVRIVSATVPSSGYFLMASTHDPDEKYFLESIKYLLKNNVEVVIAPRHTKRIDEIKKLLEKNNILPELYSDYLQRPIETTNHRNHGLDYDIIKPYIEVLLIDTYGDLINFYEPAKFTYVGGGFSERGVQNIIEPAAFGNSVLVGPNIDNFHEEIINLKNANINIIIMENTDSFVLEKDILKYVKKLNEINEDDRLKQLNNAIACVHKFSEGVLEQYLNILKEKKIIN